MIITSFSYKKTVQVKQYEPVVIEASGVPGEGQTAAEAFAELAGFVDAKMDEEIANVKGAPVTKKEAPAKKAPAVASSTAPPLKNPAGATTGSMEKTSDPPFEPGSKVAAEPAPKKSTRKPKLSEHERELQYMVDAGTLEELDERFGHLRTMADLFSIDEWEKAIEKLRERYRALNLPSSDPEIVNSIVDAANKEKKRIAEYRQNAELAEAAA